MRMQSIIFATALAALPLAAHAERYYGALPCHYPDPALLGCAPLNKTVTVGVFTGNGFDWRYEPDVTPGLCQAMLAWANVAGPGGMCY